MVLTMRLMHWKFSFYIASRVNDSTTPPLEQQWCCVKHFPTCHWVFECDTRVDTKVNTLELMLQPFTMNLRKRDQWETSEKQFSNGVFAFLRIKSIRWLTIAFNACLNRGSFLNIFESLQSSIGQNETNPLQKSFARSLNQRRHVCALANLQLVHRNVECYEGKRRN